ncbi:MAG: hypothetical protein EBS55_12285, partial [Flavobacteriaceae bacterium]|nr:hypothetical protein [Flavobacteriaceae bacterium]
MNSYELSRKWFDWCFENPEKINPNHSALYFFCIEHCNRLGWKEKFGLPTTMAKEAIGIRSYNTYINTLNDLVDFGFIKLIEKSKNQFSSNIIALSNFNKALDKALDKALIKHTTKQRESTSESISSIDKQYNKEQGTKNNDIEERKLKFAETIKPFLSTYNRDTLKEFYDYWTEPNKSNTKFKQELQKTWSLKSRLERWTKNDFGKKPNQPTGLSKMESVVNA